MQILINGSIAGLTLAVLALGFTVVYAPLRVFYLALGAIYTAVPLSVHQSITPTTKAILAVHIFGKPCDTLALREIADDRGLWYIADAAQSLGARRSDLSASALADAIVTSFTVGKTLCAGEGGAIVTDNEELYQKLVWWTQHPDRQRRDLSFGLQNEFGLNGRIHPLAAVIANATFESSLAELHAHQQRQLHVVSALNDIGLTIPLPFSDDSILPTFFSLVARWKGSTEPDGLIAALREKGIAAKIGDLPCRWILSQPAFLTQYENAWEDLRIAGDINGLFTINTLPS